MSAFPDEFRERLVAFRRDLHRHPELAFEETRTAACIERELDRIGIPYRSGVAKTGIVADIPARATGSRPGRDSAPKVALRGDMDALPIQEETGLSFASRTDGVMHACGHDAHTTMVLGAAELLARDGDLDAPVRILFQPAEERGEGARAMIEAGALDGVEMIFAGHVDRLYPTGTIVTHAGPVNASTDGFRIEITGTGGHAARPQESVDAVVVGSHLVFALQTIVSRSVNPAFPAVVTIGRFHSGSAPNVIAGRAVLEGTIRAQARGVRDDIIAAIHRIADSLATLHAAKIVTTIREGVPAVINPPEMAELARRAAAEVVGEERAVPLATANMGGEDFAMYLQQIRGCYVRLGVAGAGAGAHPAHSSQFDIDEGVLPVGAEFFYRVAKLAGQVLAEELDGES